MNRANKIYGIICLAQACVWCMHPGVQDKRHGFIVQDMQCLLQKVRKLVDPDKTTSEGLECGMYMESRRTAWSDWRIGSFEDLEIFADSKEPEMSTNNQFLIAFARCIFINQKRISLYTYWKVKMIHEGVQLVQQHKMIGNTFYCKDNPDFIVTVLEGYITHKVDPDLAVEKIEESVLCIGLEPPYCLILCDGRLAIASSNFQPNHVLWVKVVNAGVLEVVNKPENASPKHHLLFIHGFYVNHDYSIIDVGHKLFGARLVTDKGVKVTICSLDPTKAGIELTLNRYDQILKLAEDSPKSVVRFYNDTTLNGVHINLPTFWSISPKRSNLRTTFTRIYPVQGCHTHKDNPDFIVTVPEGRITHAVAAGLAVEEIEDSVLCIGLEPPYCLILCDGRLAIASSNFQPNHVLWAKVINAGVLEVVNEPENASI